MRTWKTIGKPALIPQLSTALNDNSVRPSSSITKNVLKGLRDRARNLVVLFTKLESQQAVDMETGDSQDLIMEIVSESYELTMTTLLDTALRTSSNLDPSLVSFLPEAFGKLGRYYSAASELVCAARDRQCRVFLTVQIVPCQIEVLSGVLALNTPVSIHKAADSLFRSSNLSLGPNGPLKGQLASSLSRSKAKFREAMGEISQNGKVHAEIQLLFFYELHQSSRRPRFICSSKSACYLCNLFIQLHGRFCVPRTHGRLYERWVLPDWLEGIPTDRRQHLSRTLIQMNSALEDKISRVYTGTQKPYLHPNESILVERAHWPSTSDLPERSTVSAESTVTLRQETTADHGQGSNGDQSAVVIARENSPQQPPPGFIQQASGNEIRAEASGRSTPLSGHEPPDSESSTERGEKSTEVLPSDIIPAATAARAACLPQLGSTASYQPLTRGELVWGHLPHVKHPLRISTTSIHASIILDGNEGNRDLPTNNHWMQLKWLQPDETIPENVDGARTVRLSDLERGVDVALKGVDVLYLCEAGDTLEIRRSAEGPPS
jgi:hypothetical protein